MLEKVVERFIEGKGEKLAVVAMSEKNVKIHMMHALAILSSTKIPFKVDHENNKILGTMSQINFYTRDSNAAGRDITGIYFDDEMTEYDEIGWEFVRLNGRIPTTEELIAAAKGKKPDNTPFNAEDYAALERIVKGTPTDKEVGPSLPANHERDMFVRVLREIEDECWAKMVSQSVENVLDLVDSEGRKAALRDGVENILAFRKLVDEVINEA